MGKILKIVLISLLFVFAAQAKTKFVRVKYKVKQGDRFASILKKYVKPGAKLSAKSPTVVFTRKKNPHVKSWRNLKEGTILKLYINKDIARRKKRRRTKRKKERPAQKATASKQKPRKSFSFSLFYMTSMGMFDQKATDGDSSIQFNQFSPYTLGVASGYVFGSSSFSVSGSIYYSAFNDGQTNKNQVLVHPAEIGYNLYGEYALGSRPYILYAGVDWEGFNTYDMGYLELTTGTDLTINRCETLYMTFGLAMPFRFSNDNVLFTKLSFSSTVFSYLSSLETGYSAGTYTGMKVTGYLNYKFHPHWFAHVLVKFHQMSGANNLSIIRGGIGAGYAF